MSGLNNDRAGAPGAEAAAGINQIADAIDAIHMALCHYHLVFREWVEGMEPYVRWEQRIAFGKDAEGVPRAQLRYDERVGVLEGEGLEIDRDRCAIVKLAREAISDRLREATARVEALAELLGPGFVDGPSKQVSMHLMLRDLLGDMPRPLLVPARRDEFLRVKADQEEAEAFSLQAPCYDKLRVASDWLRSAAIWRASQTPTGSEGDLMSGLQSTLDSSNVPSRRPSAQPGTVADTAAAPTQKRRIRAPAPAGWIYLNDAATKYGQSPSNLHYFASKLPKEARVSDEDSNQIRVLEAALRALLKKKGRLKS